MKPTHTITDDSFDDFEEQSSGSTATMDTCDAPD
jgi:hypothetical protein